ncbi:hypothetical protein ATY79_01140 [Rhizobium sp. R693]|nr:hypothetical protein ATY79_01140 [Rhizobium sp. R693]
MLGKILTLTGTGRFSVGARAHIPRHFLHYGVSEKKTRTRLRGHRGFRAASRPIATSEEPADLRRMACAFISMEKTVIA